MSEPLRVGLIGAGSIAAKHLEVFAAHPQRLRLAAVCDINERAARAAAATLGVERVFVDFRRMLDEVELDAVDICSVHDVHAEQAIAAARRGLHVLVEKPMAVSMEQCVAMVEEARKAGVRLMVAQNQRYKANYRAIRNVVRSGELGRILCARVESQSARSARSGERSWLFDGSRAGGGVVISLALHRVDLLRFLVGEIRRVFAHCRTTDPRCVNGAENWAAALFEFEDGALGEMFATNGAYRTAWGESLIIFGENGTVHAMPTLVSYSGPAMIASSSRPEPPPVELGEKDRKSRSARSFGPLEPDPTGLHTGNMYADEILHFADCCRDGTEPLSAGRDNLFTMRAVMGIYESSRRGEWVDLDGLYPSASARIKAAV